MRSEEEPLQLKGRREEEALQHRLVLLCSIEKCMCRFQMSCQGQISPVGNLAIIGAGASGLMCLPSQTR